MLRRRVKQIVSRGLATSVSTRHFWKRRGQDDGIPEQPVYQDPVGSQSYAEPLTAEPEAYERPPPPPDLHAMPQEPVFGGRLNSMPPPPPPPPMEDPRADQSDSGRGQSAGFQWRAYLFSGISALITVSLFDWFYRRMQRIPDGPSWDSSELRQRVQSRHLCCLLCNADRMHPADTFMHSVVLLSEFDDNGVAGIIINKPMLDADGDPVTVKDLIPKKQHELFDIELADNPLMLGGPVGLQPTIEQGKAQKPTLDANIVLIHRIPNVKGPIAMFAPGIYVGGDYSDIRRKIRYGEASPKDVMVVIGRSGWWPYQLEAEVQRGSWNVFAVDPRPRDRLTHETTVPPAPHRSAKQASESGHSREGHQYLKDFDPSRVAACSAFALATSSELVGRRKKVSKVFPAASESKAENSADGAVDVTHKPMKENSPPPLTELHPYISWKQLREIIPKESTGITEFEVPSAV